MVASGATKTNVTGAGGQWGIVVGGLGKGPGSVSIHSPFTVQSANSKEDELEADLAVVKLHPHEGDGLYSAPRTKRPEVEPLVESHAHVGVECGEVKFREAGTFADSALSVRLHMNPTPPSKSRHVVEPRADHAAITGVGGANLWIHSPRNAFIAVGGREPVPPRSPTGRPAGHAGPGDVTRGATPPTGRWSGSAHPRAHLRIGLMS